MESTKALEEPLLVTPKPSRKNLFTESIAPEILSKSSPLNQVFKKVAKMGETLEKGKKIDLNPNLIHLTRSGNILTYCNKKELILWSLENDKAIFNEE
jgi:hypothetical protein